MKYPDNFINKIICADCSSVIKDIPDSVVDLIILDPPYNTTLAKWDKIDVITSVLISEFKRVLKDTGNLYVWCGIGEKSQSLIRWFSLFNSVFVFKDLITWKKQRGIGMRKGWLYTREEIMWFVKDNKKFIWNINAQYSNEKRIFTATYKDENRMRKYLASVKSDYKRLTNVWCDIREPNISWNDKQIVTVHYTPKPIEAIQRIIFAHTQEGALVLDPFLGSGTTALACKNLKRNFIGIEITPEYCELSQKRLAANV